MTNELKEMFSSNNTQVNTAGARSLAGTAQLTNLSASIAKSVLQNVEKNINDFKELVEKSKQFHDSMDELIAKAYDLDAVDVKFLKDLGEDTLDAMLKSQQSKRSRSKNKTMTIDNYFNMLTGAIAENLIRIAADKPKMASGTRRVSGSVVYTAEELQKYADDQEALRKELRNVQSKKSIMKSKAGFSEDDEHWKALLKAEAQLKANRDSTTVVKTDETREKIEEMLKQFGDKEPKSKEGQELIAQLREMLG